MDEENKTTETETASEAPKEDGKNLNLTLISGIIALLVILGIGAVLLMRQNSQSARDVVEEAVVESPLASPFEATSSVEGAADVDESDTNVRTIKIEARSFSFSPKEIRAKVGEKIKIELTAKDQMHDFNIDELDVDGDVTVAGNTSTVEFEAGEAGEYEYYCSVGEHRKNGQVGTLIVEE